MFEYCYDVRKKILLYLVILQMLKMMHATTSGYSFMILDRKYEALLIPLFGIPTPFHISTVKVS